MTPEKIFVDDQGAYERFETCLAEVWEKVSAKFDILGELPDDYCLLEAVELDNLSEASRQILANMLTEVMEQVSRFSSWYTKPARAYGMVPVSCPAENRSRWQLAPEAVLEWQPQLLQLQQMIANSFGMIRARVLLAKLANSEHLGESTVTAGCGCSPPRVIKTPRAIFQNCEVVCNACNQVFVV